MSQISLVAKDPKLKVIIQELKKIPHTKSIILFGSKAKNNLQLPNVNSDYDIFVVLPFALVPLNYRKLKFIEMKIYNKLNIDVSINPLPILRLRRAKGNLLFYKMKNEGITIFGKDYLTEMEVGTILDIDPDEFFSYYFSSVRFLVKDMSVLNPLSNINLSIFAYNIAKSVLYCSEIREYLNGIYLENRFEILNYILSSDYFYRDEKRYVNLIKFSLNVFGENNYTLRELYEFWFLARDFSFSTFNLLAKKYDVKIDQEKQLSAYQSKKFTLVKASQYVVLSLLRKRVFPLKLFLKRISVERKVYVCIFYLMSSIKEINGENFVVEDKTLSYSYDALLSSNLIDKDEYLSLNHSKKWEKLKDCVLENWSIACSKSII